MEKKENPKVFTPTKLRSLSQIYFNLFNAVFMRKIFNVYVNLYHNSFSNFLQSKI